jgi:hypothetical protein
MWEIGECIAMANGTVSRMSSHVLVSPKAHGRTGEEMSPIGNQFEAAMQTDAMFKWIYSSHSAVPSHSDVSKRTLSLQLSLAQPCRNLKTGFSRFSHYRSQFFDQFSFLVRCPGFSQFFKSHPHGLSLNHEYETSSSTFSPITFNSSIATTMPIIKLYEKGDATLIIGSNQQHILVSTSVLRRASPVWCIMFNDRWAESQATEIRLPDDDTDAMLTVLRIAHLNFSDVPQKSSMSFHQLVQLAVVCDKYDLVGIVRPFLELHEWAKELPAWFHGFMPLTIQICSSIS